MHTTINRQVTVVGKCFWTLDGIVQICCPGKADKSLTQLCTQRTHLHITSFFFFPPNQTHTHTLWSCHGHVLHRRKGNMAQAITKETCKNTLPLSSPCSILSSTHDIYINFFLLCTQYRTHDTRNSYQLHHNNQVDTPLNRILNPSLLYWCQILLPIYIKKL